MTHSHGSSLEIAQAMVASVRSPTDRMICLWLRIAFPVSVEKMVPKTAKKVEFCT